MSRVTDHTRTEKIGGDSILIFVVNQVERETVMTAWRLRWGLKRVRPILSHMLSSMLFRMLNLSVFILVMYLCHFILLYLNNCVVIYYFAL